MSAIEGRDLLSLAFRAAEPRPPADGSQPAKKNYAERLSRHLATAFANALRRYFDGIQPDADGGKQESRARTAKGVKKLDVNYSTPELGLGLGVSIKTLNFVDSGSSRYTKNFTRIDNELRAEAKDYHQRQPYAVMIAVVFLPIEACDDGNIARESPSSFGKAVKTFRFRGGRTNPRNEEELFEALFIGLYQIRSDRGVGVRFFDVNSAPPMASRPDDDVTLSFEKLIERVREIYDARNDPPFEWKTPG